MNTIEFSTWCKRKGYNNLSPFNIQGVYIIFLEQKVVALLRSAE